MNKDIILSAVRHSLTAAGVLLVQKGYMDDATLQAVIGGIVALVGFYVFRNKGVAK